MKDNELSLYFQLANGQKADLEVVASAAIAWVESLRAVAQSVDANSDVKVELVDAEEGSLVFNTIIAWFDRTIGDKLERVHDGFHAMPRGRKLALALALFIIVTGYPTAHFYLGDDLTDEDRALLEEIVEQVRGDPAVETAKRKFFRTVEREPAITAVGIKEHSDDRPLVMIGSEHFAEAGGLWSEAEEDAQERVVTHVLDVVLVKPALVHTPRSWTFKPEGLPEFDAVMRDGVVLQAIRDSGFPERLREGIPMTIRIEAREVLVNGQWRAKHGGRSVMRVISPRIGG